MDNKQTPVSVICRIVAAAILRISGANIPVVVKEAQIYH